MIFEVGRGGGASGKLVHLLITCDSSLAGATVTAVNGTESYSATVPSGGGLITFNCKSLGTWTVSESEYSSSTDIEAQYYGNYELSCAGIPDGSTVTPTDDIQTWIKCAGLSSSYTALNQVLADNTVLLALISDENAVNYMVRSTTWASDVCTNSTAMTYIGNNDNCADTLIVNATWGTAICNSTYFEKVLNVKVPTMTSNTTPSGTASAWLANGSAYNCFNTTTMFEQEKTSASQGAWVKYDFGKSVICNKFMYQGRSADSHPSFALQFQGSNDDSSWETLASGTTSSTKGATNYFLGNTARKSFRYYRLYTTDYSNYYNSYRFTCYCMNFYGREA